MRNFITPVGEEYPFGGPGKFILGTVQAMAEQLRQEYANTVDLIYIDPPFGTGDGGAHRRSQPCKAHGNS